LVDLHRVGKKQTATDDRRILALFTGTDWCPPCKQFEAEVAHDEQFASIFGNDFVFFKSDWLRNQPQPPATVAEVERLVREYAISSYPTLLVLNSAGETWVTVEWTQVCGGSFKEIMIKAIDDARKATKGGKRHRRVGGPSRDEGVRRVDGFIKSEGGSLLRSGK
jgi:thiol-disulfide isomerase/thioredoxin